MASPAPALDNPLQLRRISELGLARVAARRGAAAALRRRVEETLALRLPDGPQRAATDEAAFLGVGAAWEMTHATSGRRMASMRAIWAPAEDPYAQIGVPAPTRRRSLSYAARTSGNAWRRAR